MKPEGFGRGNPADMIWNIDLHFYMKYVSGRGWKFIWTFTYSFYISIYHACIVCRHVYIFAYGHFPKRYSKQKRINLTFECRWHVLHFLLVAGPQLNAVVLQGSARFAQGFDSSARQVPETGEQMILANQGQNRAQASRKLAQAPAQARPSRATTCPCATTCPLWLSTLLYSELLFSG